MPVWLIVLLKPDFSCDKLVLHHLELIKLQLKHKVLYQLLQMLYLNLWQD